jgi:hypothetical protein
MPSELKDKFMESLTSINERKQQILTKGKEFQNNGDLDNTKKAQDLLIGLKEQEAVLQERYLNEAVARENTLLNGISSGEGIGFKKIKTYVPVSSGMYNPTAMPVYMEGSVPGKETNKLLQSQIAEVIGVDSNKVNVTKGVSALDTAFLAGLRKDESKKEYFMREGKGYELVKSLNVAGKENYVVKDKKGNHLLALPIGVNAKDVGAFVASETIPTMAAIAAAPPGLAASAPTGFTTSPLTIAATTSAAYSGAGLVQDMALRSMLGIDIKPKEIIVDRAKEAALGTILGFGTSKLLQPLAKRSGATIENLVAKDLKEAESLLLKSQNYKPLSEMDNLTPIGAEKAGDAGINFQKAIAGRFPNMPVAQKMQSIRNTIGEIQDVVLKGGQDLQPVDFTKVIARRDALARQISKRDENIRGMSQRLINDRVDSLKPPSVNRVELGNTLDNLLSSAEKEGKEITRQVYSGFYQEADQLGVRIPRSEVIKTFEQTLNVSRNEFKENPAIFKLYNKIKNYGKKESDDIKILDQYGKPIEIPRPENDFFSTEQLRNLIQVARDSVPVNPSKTADQVATGVSKALNDKFESVMIQNGLGGKWQQVNQTFDEVNLAFKRTSPGKILSEKFGANVKSPEQMVDIALSNTQATKDVISALRNTGDNAGADMIQGQLRNSYFEKIGISADGTFNGVNSKHAPEMIEALYPDPLVAKRINSRIAELNDVLKVSKAEKVNLNADEAKRLLDIIPINEKNALLKQIEKKAIVQQKEEKFFNNEIIKLAKNGHFENIEGDVLAKTALYNASPADLDDIMKMLTPSGQKKLGADMFSRLAKDFATGGENQLVSGKQAGLNLLDHPKLNKTLQGYSRKDGRNAPDWLKSMDKVVGKETMDEFIAASKIIEANTPLTRIETEAIGIHGVYSPTGAKWYATNPLGYLNNKVIATAYGSNNLRPLLRYISKNIGDEKYTQNFNNIMRKVTMTRPGIQSVIEQSKDDPQFTRDVGLMYAEMQDELNQEMQLQQQR